MCEVPPDWTYTTRIFETGGRRVVASIGERVRCRVKGNVAILGEGECLDGAKRVLDGRTIWTCIWTPDTSLQTPLMQMNRQ